MAAALAEARTTVTAEALRPSHTEAGLARRCRVGAVCHPLKSEREALYVAFPAVEP